MRPREGHRVDLSEVVQEQIATFREALRSQSIVISLDLDPVSDWLDADLVAVAVGRLIENAIKCMPEGGELCVTLIDCGKHWELEVADSSEQDCEAAFGPDANEDLPAMIPFGSAKAMQVAQQMASRYGGAIQSWDCPQGGVAHVIVVPKFLPPARAHNQYAA